MPSYMRSVTTNYDPIQGSHATQIRIVKFRDIEPEQPTLISKARNLLGKFFRKLIGRNGGTEEDLPKPDENVEK
jgi:hypothetical protein